MRNACATMIANVCVKVYDMKGEVIKDVDVNLSDLVHEVAADADFEANSRNRSVRISHCAECVVSGIPELLRSAIENVVRNAVRYTVEQSAVQISLVCHAENSTNPCAVISVRDYGQGVPETALGNIFLPFYRVAEARERKTGGTGLGLAIVERTVGLHHGTVKAKNAPDGGLIIEIYLPIVKT